MILTEKEKVLLGIARSCLGCNHPTEVMLESGWYEKVNQHYPIQYPGDEEQFADEKGLPDDCSTEDWEACMKEHDKVYKAWCNQLTQIWDDVKDLLNQLGAAQP